MGATSKRLRSLMAETPPSLSFMPAADALRSRVYHRRRWSCAVVEPGGERPVRIQRRRYRWSAVDNPRGRRLRTLSSRINPPDMPSVRRFRRKDRTEFVAHHATVELPSPAGIVTHAELIICVEGVEQMPAVAEARAGTPESVPSPRIDSAELRYSEEARVRLLRRLVIAQEEERRRIARDLHDHLGQQLTSLRLKLEAVRTVTPDLPDVQATLTQADALLTRIDGDIDFLSWELRPAALDDLGLKAVLENYVSEWSRHANVQARFHVEGLGDERVAPEIEATLYRIAQEALNNVARHARAQSVGVVLERRGRTLSLVVEDNGVGFDTSTISSTMIGLVGMRERAAVVGGSFDIEPTAGGGTTVLARVPLYLTDHIRWSRRSIAGFVGCPRRSSICRTAHR